jgi:hypothetical protein
MSENHLRIVSDIVNEINAAEGKPFPLIITRAFYCGCRMSLSLDVARREVRYIGEAPEKTDAAIIPVGDVSHLTRGELVTLAEDVVREKFGQFLRIDFTEGGQ